MYINLKKYYYLISLFPFFFITGSFLPDLFCSLLSVYFLYFLIKKKELNFLNNNFFYFFLIFYLILLLSSLFSNDIQLSLKSAIPYIRFGIFVLAVNYIFESYLNLESLLNKLCKILILILFILFVDSTYQAIYYKNIFGFKIDQTFRVSSVFGSELIMGGFVMRVTMLLIGILIFLKKNKYFFFTILTISYVLIIYSGERTAFYLFSIFNLILFIKFEIYKNKKDSFKIILISFIIILIFFKSVFFNRIFVMTVNQITILKEEQYKVVAFTPTHQELYVTAFNIFQKYPIFGSGLKTFRTECKNKNYSQSELGCSTHPHNFFNNWLSIMIFFSAGILTALMKYKKI